jgi:carbon storage regulator
MSLVLTRRSGEAIIIRTPEGGLRRIYVVGIEGNTVRLAIDAPDNVEIIREELLPRPIVGSWWNHHRSKFQKAAMIMATSYALQRLDMMGLLFN